MLKIAVLVSGGGTNLQALINAQTQGKIRGGEIACVVSSRADAYAIQRAQKAGIPAEVVVRKNFPDSTSYENAMLEIFSRYQIDGIVLAGFMTIISANLIRRYENKIINVHPSLIPSFCGEGYYGLHVHEAALEKGVKVTGATVHFVNEICDGGPIILQKAVAVEEDDTPEILQRRVMEQAEWEILPKAVSLFCEGRLKVEDGKVRIL